MESKSALMDNLVLSDDGESSDTLYIRGFPRAASFEVIRNVLAHDNEHLHSTIQIDNENVLIDHSEYQIRNIIRVKYSSLEMAEARLRALQQHMVMGKVLSVKYELGIDPITKKPRVSGKTHNTIIRKITMNEAVLPNNEGTISLGQKTTQKRSIAKASMDSVSMGDSNSNEILFYNDESVQSKEQIPTCQGCKRKVRPTSIKPASDAIPITFNYTYKSIQLHHNSTHADTASKNTTTIDFPFPSGLYLTRTIQLTRTHTLSNPLLRLVLNSDNLINHSMYAKEISESMAMVDAVFRALKMLNYDSLLKSPSNLPSHSNVGTKEPQKVKVYVLGDGKIPLSAACLCLHLPENFSFYSIDPILDIIPISTEEESTSSQSQYSYAQRFHQHRCMSQDFPLDCSNEEVLSIVVACHSHAPLQEFWSRLTTSRKIAIVMPCCADYARLQVLQDDDANSSDVLTHSKQDYAKLILSFDDFEVFSAKRKIHIYTNVD